MNLMREGMEQKFERGTPEWQWQQLLLDHYYDYRYHKLLDPLYEQFSGWKAGELTHESITSHIHEVHKETGQLFNLFGQNRNWLLQLIQFDREWFSAWLDRHPAPPGIQLAPVLKVEEDELKEP